MSLALTWEIQEDFSLLRYDKLIDGGMSKQ